MKTNNRRSNSRKSKPKIHFIADAPESRVAKLSNLKLVYILDDNGYGIQDVTQTQLRENVIWKILILELDFKDNAYYSEKNGLKILNSLMVQYLYYCSVICYQNVFKFTNNFFD